MHVGSALLAAAWFVAASLQGCETNTQKALRQSCSWSDDLALKGCDQRSFAQCVGGCEFCMHGEGTPFAGRQDECAQLKCAAYCARRNGDNCLATYQPLCQDAVQLMQEQDAVPCDVQCSASSRVSPSPAAWLGLALLAAGWAAAATPAGGTPAGGTPAGDVPASSTPRRACAARGQKAASALVGMVCLGAALALQGCNAPPCGNTVPTIGWEVDLDELDRLAGCRQGWLPLWGNPCASEVPILWAKKGIHKDADRQLIRNQVANKDYECLRHDGSGYCSMWTRHDPRCDVAGFGICTCNRAGGTGGNSYCEAWRCVTKQVAQTKCRVVSSDDGDSVDCDSVGSSPLQVDLEDYQSLLQAEGTSNITTISQAEALRVLRKGWSHKYDFRGECIVPHDISEPYAAPCENWRVIRTELQFCQCQKEEESGRFCLAWTCENSKLGLFSVLFAGNRSYSDAAAGLLKKQYECTESVSTSASTAICSAYRGHSRGLSEVNLFQCRGCSEVSQSCSRWKCNEYKLDRISEEDHWGQRLLYWFLHWLWIMPILLPSVLCFFPAGKDWDGRAHTAALSCFSSFVGVWVSLLLIWCIGFVRSTPWGPRVPVEPFQGLVVTMLPPWLTSVPLCLWGRVFPCSAFLTPLVMLLVTLTYVLGFVALLGFLGILLSCTACVCACRWLRS